MLLSNGDLAILNNRKNNPVGVDRIKTFPNFGLQKLRADLNIDTINADHIMVSYTEFNERTNKTGTITFNDSKGQILNVTTNKTALQKNNLSTARLSSNFMNRGKLDVLFTFNLTDTSASYSYKGSIGPMNLQVLNPAIMPLALVKINSGKLKQMDFDITADSKISKGKVAVLYNDLKVTVLKPDTSNNMLKRLTIASLYANTMVIKRNNPDREGGQPRSFYVAYNRPKNSTFFKTIWRTLLAGIKPCAGLDEKMQQNVKATIAEHAVQKRQRIIKKAQRKQRRERRQRGSPAHKKLNSGTCHGV